MNAGIGWIFAEGHGPIVNIIGEPGGVDDALTWRNRLVRMRVAGNPVGALGWNYSTADLDEYYAELNPPRPLTAVRASEVQQVLGPDEAERLFRQYLNGRISYRDYRWGDILDRFANSGMLPTEWQGFQLRFRPFKPEAFDSGWAYTSDGWTFERGRGPTDVHTYLVIARIPGQVERFTGYDHDIVDRLLGIDSPPRSEPTASAEPGAEQSIPDAAAPAPLPLPELSALPRELVGLAQEYMRCTDESSRFWSRHDGSLEDQMHYVHVSDKMADLASQRRAELERACVAAGFGKAAVGAIIEQLRGQRRS